MYKFEIMTYSGKQESFNVKSVIIPTSDGNRTVLEKHMDVVVEVSAGTLKIRLEDDVNQYFVSDGLFYFSESTGVMIVSSFERADEIDFQRAHVALERAASSVKNSADIFELKKAEHALKRAVGRLRLE